MEMRTCALETGTAVTWFCGVWCFCFCFFFFTSLFCLPSFPSFRPPASSLSLSLSLRRGCVVQIAVFILTCLVHPVDVNHRAVSPLKRFHCVFLMLHDYEVIKGVITVVSLLSVIPSFLSFFFSSPLHCLCTLLICK